MITERLFDKMKNDSTFKGNDWAKSVSQLFDEQIRKGNDWNV